VTGPAAARSARCPRRWSVTQPAALRLGPPRTAGAWAARAPCGRHAPAGRRRTAPLSSPRRVGVRSHRPAPARPRCGRPARRAARLRPVCAVGRGPGRGHAVPPAPPPLAASALGPAPRAGVGLGAVAPRPGAGGTPPPRRGRPPPRTGPPPSSLPPGPWAQPARGPRWRGRAVPRVESPVDALAVRAAAPWPRTPEGPRGGPPGRGAVFGTGGRRPAPCRWRPAGGRGYRGPVGVRPGGPAPSALAPPHAGGACRVAPACPTTVVSTRVAVMDRWSPDEGTLSALPRPWMPQSPARRGRLHGTSASPRDAALLCRVWACPPAGPARRGPRGAGGALSPAVLGASAGRPHRRLGAAAPGDPA
jgi:hypothetical protein